jgi:hypothetical protein
MRCFIPVIPVALCFLICFTKCSKKEIVSKGDSFIALMELTEVADIQGAQNYTDEFTGIIPKGTILRALSNSNAGFFECRPVEINGKSGEEYILSTFVPEFIRNKESFKNFSITLSIEYIGTKIKKVGQ